MAKPSERNRQVVRQWEILIKLDERGRTLKELVAAVGDGSVTTRTIRRDLEALQSAGFSLYDVVDDDGVRRWELLARGVTPARRAA